MECAYFAIGLVQNTISGGTNLRPRVEWEPVGASENDEGEMGKTHSRVDGLATLHRADHPKSRHYRRKIKTHFAFHWGNSHAGPRKDLEITTPLSSHMRFVNHYGVLRGVIFSVGKVRQNQENGTKTKQMNYDILEHFLLPRPPPEDLEERFGEVHVEAFSQSHFWYFSEYPSQRPRWPQGGGLESKNVVLLL